MRLKDLNYGTEYAINTSENNRKQDDVEFGIYRGQQSGFSSRTGKPARKVAIFEIRTMTGTTKNRRTFFAPQFIVATREQYEIDHARKCRVEAARRAEWNEERTAKSIQRSLAIRALFDRFEIKAMATDRLDGIVIGDSDLADLVARRDSSSLDLSPAGD